MNRSSVCVSERFERAASGLRVVPSFSRSPPPAAVDPARAMLLISLCAVITRMHLEHPGSRRYATLHRTAEQSSGREEQGRAAQRRDRCALIERRMRACFARLICSIDSSCVRSPHRTRPSTSTAALLSSALRFHFPSRRDERRFCSARSRRGCAHERRGRGEISARRCSCSCRCSCCRIQRRHRRRCRLCRRCEVCLRRWFEGRDRADQPEDLLQPPAFHL